ncbi:MAG: hypothetical protein V1722_01030 [Candidatus Micrarchaeota archaeon]
MKPSNEQLAAAKAYFEKVGMKRYGWLTLPLQIKLHEAVQAKTLTDKDVIELGRHLASSDYSKTISPRLETVRNAGLTDGREIIDVLLGKKTVDDKELTALVNAVKDKVAFSIHAHGFHEWNIKGQYHTDYPYEHAQRNLRPQYFSTEHDSKLITIHPTMRRYIAEMADSTTLLHHGVIPRGRFEHTYTDHEKASRQVKVPQTWWDKLRGQQRTEEVIEYRPVTKKSTVIVPGLHEVTTLTDKPANIHVLMYAFPHAGSDDSTRRANAPQCYMLTDGPTYKKITAFIKRRPEKTHALFERLAGDFPRKADIFQPKKAPLRVEEVNFGIR